MQARRQSEPESQTLLQSPHGGTYYDVLGVPRDATDEVIRAAFRVAAKACHPDVNGGDAEAQKRLQEVIAAYQLLRSPQKRAIYDQELAANERALNNPGLEWDRRSIAAAAVAAFMSASLVTVAVRLSSDRTTPSPVEGGNIGIFAGHPRDGNRSDEAIVVHPDEKQPWQKAAKDKSDKQAQKSLAESTEVTIAKNRAEASIASIHQLERSAANFVIAQVTGWSSTNTIDLVSLANAYADEVLYYGSARSIQAVLLDKRRIMERWPERVYEVRSEQISVQCVANRCRVHGLVDWKMQSTPRAASARGLSRFDYEIVSRDDVFTIVREESAVVKAGQTISGR